MSLLASPHLRFSSSFSPSTYPVPLRHFLPPRHLHLPPFLIPVLFSSCFVILHYHSLSFSSPFAAASSPAAAAASSSASSSFSFSPLHNCVAPSLPLPPDPITFCSKPSVLPPRSWSTPLPQFRLHIPYFQHLRHNHRPSPLRAMTELLLFTDIIAFPLSPPNAASSLLSLSLQLPPPQPRHTTLPNQPSPPLPHLIFFPNNNVFFESTIRRNSSSTPVQII